jgi:hypothetical protein
MKNRNGISLIVLVITIIVIIILAGAVILSLANNNPISQASEANFKSNVDSYNSELTMALSNQYLNDTSFDPSTFNKGTWDGESIGETIKKYIPSMTVADGLKFEIQSGILVYVGEDEKEQNWFTNMGMENGSSIPPQQLGLGVDVIATENTTVNGQPASYDNPIIPTGFKAIEDGTTWPDDWNTGLVIEDEAGNQFVWVPVDGTDVPYAKWCTSGVSYLSTTDDTLPTGVTLESYQVTTYGGFYIARYTTGKEGTDTAVSKKSVAAWTSINYDTARSEAYSVHTTNEVKSGLVTGSQWDTTMKWIENSGKSVTDCRAWGNYGDAISPANVSGMGTTQVTGYSEFWKANNIYDLAGNTREWTNEGSGSQRIYRSGYASSNGQELPAAFRLSADTSNTDSVRGFRVALYIL